MTEVQETFHKGFNLFTHVSKPAIRNWNRLVTMINIMSQIDNGVKEAARYRSLLPKEEQQELITLFDRMKTEGFQSLQNEARSQA
jgi:hypothetical protein